MKRFTFCVTALLLMAPLAIAQETAPAPDPGPAEISKPIPSVVPPLPDRWLLLCCGLPGDDEHRERLTGAMEKIIAASEQVLGVAPERLRVLAGDEEMRDAIADQAPSIGICTKESVSTAMQSLCDDVDADDSCWVLLLGHAHLYGNASQFNVLETDFEQTEFAAWAKPLTCREQVYWVTMPVSGFWIKPLSGKTRVVISATEPDLEFTGTEMPYALSDLLAGDGEHQSVEDVDQDGSLSLLDLYLATSLEVHGRFTAMERLQTEHAQLDDNGDGRGSEIQLAYLPVEEEEEEEESEEEPQSSDAAGTPDESAEEAGQPSGDSPPKVQIPKPISNVNLDGFRSRSVLIREPGS